MDYSKTLNLPKTDFPMKANLREREPAIQALWRELRVYEQSIAPVSYTHLRAHDTPEHLVCRLPLGKKKKQYIIHYLFSYH